MHVLSHALHYGTGVFERARCYDTTRGPAIFRWEEHLDRLYDSAKFYEMEIPFSREELTEADRITTLNPGAAIRDSSGMG